MDRHLNPRAPSRRRFDENTAVISVRDDGVGLPADFDLGKSRDWACRSSRDFQKNYRRRSATGPASMVRSSC
jgi:hypothetical protein